MEKNIQIPAITIDPVVMFLEDERPEEFRAYVAQRNAVKEIWDNLINNENDIFRAAQFAVPGEYEQTILLSPSTREGVDWQLSFVDKDGIPAMHEDYIFDENSPQYYRQKNKDALLSRLADFSLHDREIIARVMYDEREQERRKGNMEYVLMHKNIPVIQFSLSKYTSEIIKVSDSFNANHLPVGVSVKDNKVNRKELNDWWMGRSIPTSRSGIRNILESLQLSSTQELVTKSLALSLSDHYWFKPEGRDDIQWENINFFENSFSEDIGDVLFNGRVEKRNFDFNSPDNTSDGWLKKRWKIIDGERCLVKGGTPPNMYEPFNEVISSKIMDRLNVPHVAYSIMWKKGVPYSVCKDFITVDTELVSANQISKTLKKNNHTSYYQHLKNCSESLGIGDITHQLDQMLVVDYIIANADRHLNNFGFIRDVDTLEWKGFAPIYDSGSSLGYSRVTAKILDRESYESRPFKKTHDEQIKLVSDLSWIDFTKLNNIEEIVNECLAGAEDYVSENRKQAIISLLNKRIERLQEIAKQRESQKEQETNMADKTYEKQWFATELEAKEFAERTNGEVYDADFIGGYTVMYPVDEQIMVKFQSAALSAYEGYDVFAQYDRNAPARADTRVYLGKRENYDNKGNYNNSDNSLVYVSSNPKMFNFLSSSEGWIMSQQEMVDNGTFSVDDYREYADLRKGVLSNFNEITEKKFSIDITRPGSGVPFVAPDEKNKNVTRIFVDMDGTLARFHDEVQYLERMYEKGFFENLKPFDNVIDGIKIFIQQFPECEVYALSSAIASEYCTEEKNNWLDKYLPEIPMENRIFPPIGSIKADYVAQVTGKPLSDKDFLLDDYTKNLLEWKDGKGIKLVNNINRTNGVWKGDTIRYDLPKVMFAKQLFDIVYDNPEREKGELDRFTEKPNNKFEYSIGWMYEDNGHIKREFVDMAQTIGEYESSLNVPENERVTKWFGDLGIYEIKYQVTEEQFREAYKNTKEFEEMREYLGVSNSSLEGFKELIQTAIEYKKEHIEDFNNGKLGMGLEADFYGTPYVLEDYEEHIQLTEIENKNGLIIYKIEPKSDKVVELSQEEIQEIEANGGADIDLDEEIELTPKEIKEIEEIGGADVTITPAENLPEGWEWHDYTDGSGGLDFNGMSREHYFSYDLSPYAAQMIEYKEDSNSRWDIFEGTLSEFKEYAESKVFEKIKEKESKLNLKHSNDSQEFEIVENSFDFSSFTGIKKDLLETAKEKGLTDEQIGAIANSGYTPEQMDDVLYALEKGLSIEQAQAFALPEYAHKRALNLLDLIKEYDYLSDELNLQLSVKAETENEKPLIPFGSEHKAWKESLNDCNDKIDLLEKQVKLKGNNIAEYGIDVTAYPDRNQLEKQIYVRCSELINEDYAAQKDLRKPDFKDLVQDAASRREEPKYKTQSQWDDAIVRMKERKQVNNNDEKSHENRTKPVGRDR